MSHAHHLLKSEIDLVITNLVVALKISIAT